MEKSLVVAVEADRLEMHAYNECLVPHDVHHSGSEPAVFAFRLPQVYGV